MLALSSIYRRAFASATSEREQQQQQQQRAAGAGLGAEEVEIAVLGGQEAGPGGSRAERAVADADSPAVVIIEDVSGNIYLGVDPPKYETQRAQARERLRAQAASQPVPEEEFLDHEEFIRFADEYQLALIQRRKKGCLFLLGMDIVYLMFIASLPLLLPHNNNASYQPPPEYYPDFVPANATANVTVGPNGTEVYEYVNGTYLNSTAPYLGGTYFASGAAHSADDNLLFGIFDKNIVELVFFLSIDVLGIVSVIRGSPAMLTVFVVLLGCVTVLTAIRSLSPVLVFRMIIIMLALQLRASILISRPAPSGERPPGMLANAGRRLRGWRARQRQRREEDAPADAEAATGTAASAQASAAAEPSASAAREAGGQPATGAHDAERHNAATATSRQRSSNGARASGSGGGGPSNLLSSGSSAPAPSARSLRDEEAAQDQYRRGMAGGGWGPAI